MAVEGGDDAPRTPRADVTSLSPEQHANGGPSPPRVSDTAQVLDSMDIDAEELPGRLEEAMRKLVADPSPSNLDTLHGMLRNEYNSSLPALPTALWAALLPLLRGLYVAKAEPEVPPHVRQTAMTVLLHLLRKDRAFLDANLADILDEMLGLAARPDTKLFGKSAIEVLLPVLPVTRSVRHVSERLPAGDEPPQRPDITLYTESDDCRILSEALKLLQNLVLVEEPSRLHAHLDAGLQRRLTLLAQHDMQQVRFGTAHCMAKVCARLGMEPGALFGSHVNPSTLQIVAFYMSKWASTEREAGARDAPGEPGDPGDPGDT